MKGCLPSTPFVVISTKEEHALLHMMGLKPGSQALVDGRYDVLTVQVGGKPRKIWFDVSRQMAYYSKILGGAKEGESRGSDDGDDPETRSPAAAPPSPDASQ